MLQRPEGQFIWCEAYRPETISAMVLPKPIKTMMKKFIEEGQIANLLLHSPCPGTGKTSLSEALVKELDAEYKQINFSKDRGIEIVRQEIEQFAMCKSFNNKPKIVLLEEFHSATIQAQDAMKSLIEKVSHNCRFIITANEIQKIIEPLSKEGRFLVLDFSFREKIYVEELKPKMIKRLSQILENEDIPFEQDSLVQIVDKHYPSLRTMTSVLQRAASMYGKIDQNVNALLNIDDEFMELFFARNLTMIRNYIKERNLDERFMYKQLFDNVVPKIKKENQAQAIYAIAEYEARITMYPEIQLSALILTLFSLI